MTEDIMAFVQMEHVQMEHVQMEYIQVHVGGILLKSGGCCENFVIGFLNCMSCCCPCFIKT